MTASAKSLAILAALGSAALLAGALFFQFLGYTPCHLCLLQRWPHAAAVLIGGLVWLTGARLLAWAGALAATTTGVLGLYHTGVERGIFAGPDTCTSGPVGGLSVDDLMNQINAAPLVRCDEVAWSLMGLSMASWNAVFSFVLAALWIAAARRR